MWVCEEVRVTGGEQMEATAGERETEKQDN